MKSDWRGFIPESKRFMGYESMNLRQRIGFWLRVPSAWLRYRSMW